MLPSYPLCLSLSKIIEPCNRSCTKLSSCSFFRHSLTSKVDFSSSQVIIVSPYIHESIKCSKENDRDINNITPYFSLGNLIDVFQVHHKFVKLIKMGSNGCAFNHLESKHYF